MNKIIGRYILDSYKKSKQSSADNSLVNSLQAAHITVNKTKYCFLVSNGANGWSSARFVEPIVEHDFSAIWIGTSPKLRKVIEIQGNTKVTLAFGHVQERANVVIYGEACIESDVALRKKYWKGEWRLFFPDGPTGNDYVLIMVRPVRMEIMSFHRNVILEPFGLKPSVLNYQNGKWCLETNSA